ncbi:phage terminase small subunit P27 family [Brevibacillus porteri]|nr:phage terminase small subunit P27 family [Brevibacillus porteri]MED2134924.1 phage terminase small subunit P27 family [Brevibacillus porteri]MED2748431.1 phage terminase small subunit P27 family [Brevibacillus porteri]MED2818355.1 phage terminase small subunit P27 family [Brevibacillus porteri]MED2897686.1 phage terminase small subunit P27 family [Brevibacillus porteri]
MRHMARRAKPVELHLIQGNQSRLTKKEIEHRQEAEERLKPKKNRVKPPSWLDKVAKSEFTRLAKELAELDLVTNVDVNALATYCDAYSDYVQCTKIIQEEGLVVEHTNKAGETNSVPHPLLTKKKQLHDQMRSLAIEFGLTPSARAGLAKPKKEQKPQTSFDKAFGDSV